MIKSKDVMQFLTLLMLKINSLFCVMTMRNFDISCVFFNYF